jgi:predicted AlkP superfamily pyrophosphatase or phosphodiesterase
LRAAAITALLVIAVLGVAAVRACSTAAGQAIVVLVSIDGWRWDYIDRFAPPNIVRLARSGVRADALIPIFPSKTFPNHYTIVTGLYPEHHGIVSNNMVDPALPGRFTLSNRDVQQDTRWWGGEPLWVTVERQGQIAATMFWPGSDVEIAHDRPTYWRMFDTTVPNEARVDQLLEWLKQPEGSRPTFLTLYFSEVDSAGHDFGPDAAQTRQAAANVDAAIGRLTSGIEQLGLGARVNIVLVSDHGMSQLSHDRVIVLDDLVDLSTVDLIDSAPIVGMTPREGVTAESVYLALRSKHPALEVYTRGNLPEQYRLRNHPRLPEVIGIADDGWHPTTRSRLAKELQGGELPGGNHGFDPKHKSMHGLFVAGGPHFKRGLTVPAFENVHLYEMLCRILGVEPAPNDGDANVTSALLR